MLRPTELLWSTFLGASPSTDTAHIDCALKTRPIESECTPMHCEGHIGKCFKGDFIYMIGGHHVKEHISIRRTHACVLFQTSRLTVNWEIMCSGGKCVMCARRDGKYNMDVRVSTVWWIEQLIGHCRSVQWTLFEIRSCALHKSIGNLSIDFDGNKNWLMRICISISWLTLFLAKPRPAASRSRGIRGRPHSAEQALRHPDARYLRQRRPAPACGASSASPDANAIWTRRCLCSPA